MAALAESVGLEHLSLEGLRLPATIRLAEPLSDEELIAFSRRNRPYRIERNAEGELEIMSPLGFEGGQRELFVGRMLGNWAEEHGGVCVSSNAGFTLANGAVRSPDASWTSDELLSRLTRDEWRKFAPICPEFLIEILSETDSRHALEAKMKMWIDNGAQLAWMIDPFAAEVLIYKPGATVQRLLRPDWVKADSVVEGFQLETSRLWAETS
jgi:Uma2 family endonuclease